MSEGLDAQRSSNVNINKNKKLTDFSTKYGMNILK